MVTTTRPGWWERLESSRAARGHTVREVARSVGVSQQTLYNWRDARPPESADVVRALADYLQEDFDPLWAEMRHEPDTGLDALLRAYAARDLNAMNTAAKQASLAAVLDPQDAGRVELVDVVLRQLRRKFPRAELGVRRMRRGRTIPRDFQYAVLVRDEKRSRQEVTQDLHEVLRELRLPVSIEHSLELLPEHWREHPVVLVPVHLAPRTADWSRNEIGGLTTLVLGVWYSGAPDAAAAAAEQLGAGSDSITNLSAMAGSWDVASARSDKLLEAQQTRLAQHITSAMPPYSGPFIWANNDVPPVLHPDVRSNLLTEFTGCLVVIELEEEVLRYAAYRSHTASGKPVEDCLAELRGWQRQLLETAQTRRGQYRDQLGNPPAVARVLLTMPPGVEPTIAGWNDEVDPFFDKYIEIGDQVAAWLRQVWRKENTPKTDFMKV